LILLIGDPIISCNNEHTDLRCTLGFRLPRQSLIADSSRLTQMRGLRVNRHPDCEILGSFSSFPLESVSFPKMESSETMPDTSKADHLCVLIHGYAAFPLSMTY
jgi:hypothetical protein